MQPAAVKVHVGSGGTLLSGFINIDVRPRAGDRVGHMAGLSGVADGSACLIFANAVLEHLFLAHHLGALREVRRALHPQGSFALLGVPDFAAVAREYLSGAAGGAPFDLWSVYRYTHGEPEQAVSPGRWASWRPDRRPDRAPDGWMPQLHKGLFDANYLQLALEGARLHALLFSYRYPGERRRLDLGCVARRGDRPSPAEAVATLEVVPAIERWIDLESIEAVEPVRAPERMFAEALALDEQVAPGRRVRLRRMLGHYLRALWP